MKHNKHLTFLDADASKYTFKQIHYYPLIELFKQSAELVLTQQFIKKNREELHTYVLQYEVEDGHKKWRIIKKVQDFFDFKEDLHYSYKQKLLPIPIQNSSQITEDMYPQLLQFFQLFLNNLVKQSDITEQLVFKKFVCNNLTHQNKQLKVYYQGYLNKRNWGRHNEWGFKKIFQFLASWEKRYFTITKEGVFFSENENNLQILDNLILSTTFSFHCGQASAGYQYGILINSSHRALQLDAQDVFTFALSVYFLGKAVSQNKNISQNRYGSFARIRSGCSSEYFIDGQDYFSSLCDSLLSAKKQVFIAGWMISPYFSLKRPDDKEQYRFDVVISKIAKAGIKVNILIYNAPTLALNNDPQFSEKYLTGISSNIRVLLHPNYLLIPFMWSHHEKMVIIDQKIAYLGGIDIGYGRFDSKLHYLTDISSDLWPGVDYCNFRVTDIYSPKQFRSSSINRKSVPRMPWHDIAVKLMGASVQDLSRHFIQYWNHANFQLSMNDRQLLVYTGLSTIMQVQDTSTQQVTKQKQENNYVMNRRALSQREQDNNENLGDSFDFLNFDSSQSKKNKIQQFNILTQSLNSSYSSSTYELQRNSIATNQQQLEFYKSHLQINKIKQFLKKINPQNIINHRYGTNFENVVLDQGADYHIKTNKSPIQTHQIVRSNSMWGIGLEESETQQSILNAYLQLIRNAKEFIYIQNQFFISQENGVIKLLCKRIIEAYKKKEKFRVIVLLPALPGFEGHPADENASIFRVQVHLALSNVKHMYHKLSKRMHNIDDYLFFFSLRTHDLLNGKPVTQIIYIHSKLMIVDDRVAIIGSANINDRSLMGNRDTELCVIIQDENPQQLKIGQQTYLVSKFAHELRKQLYMQHFGLTENESVDYFNDQIWFSMIETSKKNHIFYRQIFGCYPDDEMTAFNKMKDIQKKADLSKYALYSPLIKGQAIPYQKQFLSSQDLTLKPNQKEFFMPSIGFT